MRLGLIKCRIPYHLKLELQASDRVLSVCPATCSKIFSEQMHGGKNDPLGKDPGSVFLSAYFRKSVLVKNFPHIHAQIPFPSEGI